LLGIGVLSVEVMQALPYATQMLAGLGAHVVKVEMPGSGDSARRARPSIEETDGSMVGATFMRTNLGKRSVCLDLRRERGRELFLALATRMDVVAENLRYGAMQDMGLGPDGVRERNPGVVYLSVSGFGKNGDDERSSWPAYAPIAEAMAGFMEAFRPPDKLAQLGARGSLGDLGTALFAVIAVLAALMERQTTATGRYIDLSMYDAMVALADMVPNLWSLGVPGGGRMGGAVADVFAAADGFFVLQVIRESEFERLASALGHPEWLDDPQLCDRNHWGAHTESVFRPAIEEWAALRSKREAAAALCGVGVAAAPCQTAEEVACDPHLRRRGMVLEVDRPLGGEPVLVAGDPVRAAWARGGSGQLHWPRLGEHTDEVLKGVLELSDADIAALRAEGVIEVAGDTKQV